MNNMSDTAFQDLSDCEEHEALESTSQLMSKAESTLATLEAFKERLVTVGKVDKASANTLRTLTIGMESMDAHFSKCPVNSYTVVPTETNVKATLEGLVSNIAAGIIKAIKAIYAFIKNMVKALLGISTSNRQKFETMQKNVKSFVDKKSTTQKMSKPIQLTEMVEQKTDNDLSTFTNKTASTDTSNNRYDSVIDKIENNSMALWLGGVIPLGDYFITRHPNKFPEALFYYEKALAKQLAFMVDYHKRSALRFLAKEQIDEQARVLDLNVHADLQQQLSPISEINQLFFFDDYHEDMAARGKLLSGEYSVQRFRKILDALRDKSFLGKYRIQTTQEFQTWKNSILANQSLLKENGEDTSKFMDEVSSGTTDLERLIEKTLQTDKRPMVQYNLLAISRNLRDLTQCISLYESILTHYRNGAAVALEGLTV